MKYRKISFNNHPVLGNVSFDFTDSSGRTVDTIIIAGENGCGKSVLLSFLNTYNPSIPAKQFGFSVTVEVELSEKDIKILFQEKDFVNILGNRFSGNIISIIHDTTFPDDNSRAKFVSKNGEIDSEYAFQFARNPSLYKSVFSDVEINFSPKNIQYTTSTNLDIEVGGPERSSANLATEISQLLACIIHSRCSHFPMSGPECLGFSRIHTDLSAKTV